MTHSLVWRLPGFSNRLSGWCTCKGWGHVATGRDQAGEIKAAFRDHRIASLEAEDEARYDAREGIAR